MGEMADDYSPGGILAHEDADSDGFIEAGASKAVKAHVPSKAVVQDVPAPSESTAYTRLTKQLEIQHGELIRLEAEGKLVNTGTQSGLAGEYQRRMRLNVNMLFSFLNKYIDVLSDLEKELAEKRQALFMEQFKQPKGSANSAEKYAKEMTTVDQATVKIVQNRINQIKNDYERYNGITISLQSTVKAESTERMAG